jgi:hypothetical protein
MEQDRMRQALAQLQNLLPGRVLPRIKRIAHDGESDIGNYFIELFLNVAE